MELRPQVLNRQTSHHTSSIHAPSTEPLHSHHYSSRARGLLRLRLRPIVDAFVLLCRLRGRSLLLTGHLGTRARLLPATPWHAPNASWWRSIAVALIAAAETARSLEASPADETFHLVLRHSEHARRRHCVAREREREREGEREERGGRRTMSDFWLSRRKWDPPPRAPSVASAAARCCV